MPSPPVVIEPAAAYPRRAAEWLAETMAGVLATQRQCAIALSGGATPRPVYAALAEPALADGIEWRRVAVYFGDERAVPPDHGDSNFRMATDALLSRVPIPKAQIHRMEGERHDLEAAAVAYEHLLPPSLDVLVLGMGADGHTVSLFPGSPALQERRRRVVVVEGPTPPRLRLTITPPVIAAAHRVVVLVMGSEKAATVARALEGDAAASEVPAALARHGVWVLDRLAAARLTRSVA